MPELIDFQKTNNLVTLLEDTLNKALSSHASDLFIEHDASSVLLRYKRFGQIHLAHQLPQNSSHELVAHIKALAGLDVANSNLPQDGRMSHNGTDIRVATTPTQYGESVTLRILDRSLMPLGLDHLGMPTPIRSSILSILERSEGLILVTGPTGTGKTTTLYSMLQNRVDAGLKVLSAEDPVEYSLQGVVQVPVSPKFTYADSLRSFMRQDPDVLMVGEIRDRETASVAIQAALTGHLVLSTLHTKDTTSAVARLMDLGVDRAMISSALQGVLSQKLNPIDCPQCAAQGCPQCAHTGITNQKASFEWLPVGEDLREQIVQGASLSQMKEATQHTLLKG